jgi:hypothetical protein
MGAVHEAVGLRLGSGASVFSLGDSSIVVEQNQISE